MNTNGATGGMFGLPFIIQPKIRPFPTIASKIVCLSATHEMRRQCGW
jgi:hypothetical protein